MHSQTKEVIIYMSSAASRALAKLAGSPVGRHPRRRGARGRKRALCAGWRPMGEL